MVGDTSLLLFSSMIKVLEVLEKCVEYKRSFMVKNQRLMIQRPFSLPNLPMFYSLVIALIFFYKHDGFVAVPSVTFPHDWQTCLGSFCKPWYGLQSLFEFIPWEEGILISTFWPLYSRFINTSPTVRREHLNKGHHWVILELLSKSHLSLLNNNFSPLFQILSFIALNEYDSCYLICSR